MIGGLTTQPVDEYGIAAGFEFASDAADLANASLEQPCGLCLRPTTLDHPLHHLQNIPFTLTHLDTVPVLYLDHLVSPST
jgi:hypothetical protein